jgi:HK97 gp10 family phage protein
MRKGLIGRYQHFQYLNLIKVNFIGLDSLKAKIDKASNETKTLVDAELQAAAMNFVGLAKKDLASQGGDRGTLLRSISYSKKADLVYEVSANTFYAPFIEFGTKSKFNPYPGTEEFASQYKGVKGSGALTLIEAITGWVKRKRIGATYNIKTRRKVRQSKDEINRIAFLIARSIYKNGISPKPFFFKQITPVRNDLVQNVTRVLDGI